MTPIPAVASVWRASLAPITSLSATAGAGIDLVSLASFAELYNTGGQAFLDNGWTPAEQHDAHGSPASFAARWAAKEAVMKALRCGLGDLDPLDIEIVTEADGAPRVVLHHSARQAATRLGVTRWHVSLCHEDGWAAALAIAEHASTSSDPSARHEGNDDA